MVVVASVAATLAVAASEAVMMVRAVWVVEGMVRAAWAAAGRVEEAVAAKEAAVLKVGEPGGTVAKAALVVPLAVQVAVDSERAQRGSHRHLRQRPLPREGNSTGSRRLGRRHGPLQHLSS